MKTVSSLYRSVTTGVFAVAGVWLSMALAPALAASTDISQIPLATASDVVAKPNIVFILDNSGSMADANMPDEMNGTGRYGYWSAQCNGVAYDPTFTYAPPKNADGSSFAPASFGGAPNDGFVTGGSSSNLNNSYYYRYTGSQPKMSWKYTTGGVDTTTTFYSECRTSIVNDTGNGVFTKVTITTASTEAQNYANWYSYYRTRRLTARTSAGKAFQALGSGYRVGFTTISETGVTEGVNFLDVRDFEGTQKSDFFTKLYAATGNSYTPLRASLSKVGRYFAKAVSGQTYDPVQYSCQRNYALLSTDGYWNSDTETGDYKPRKLDGTTNVGQQDGAEVKPMWDGANSVVTSVTTNTVSGTRTRSRDETTQTIWTRKDYVVAKYDCSGSNRRVREQPQTATQINKIDRYLETQSATGTYTVTVTTTNGTAAAPVTSATTWGAATTTGTSVSTIQGAGPAPTNAAYSNSGTASNISGYGCKSAVLAEVDRAALATLNGGDPTPGLVGTPSAAFGAYTTPTAYTAGTATAGTPVITGPVITGGSSNSLADVAEYFYATDLRDASLSNCTGALGAGQGSVCANNVATSGRDTATHQHMTTFTIGLGVNGTLTYDRSYLSQASGDYVNLVQGTKTWPIAAEDSATAIDDLWHAAVNGRGQYFATSNADTLSEAISAALSNVTAVTGSSSAAATSSQLPVAGDSNRVFVAKYTTVDWTGDVEARTLDGSTGQIGTTPEWSAKTQLDALAPGTRKIYYRQPSTGSRRDFTYANLSVDGLGGNFSGFCSKSPVPLQCATLKTDATDNEVALANDGVNLVDFLRGVRTYEQTNANDALYRTRANLLGDIINAAPAYLAKPPFAYVDAGYVDFVADHATRSAVVYVAANDGMLHALSASSGAELWAYVPSLVMNKMFRLADMNYRNDHQYFVDGSPIIGDIKVGTTWKTILVGGLNLGGKGYYALDITDPANPIPLWEFTDPDLGYTFGNPVITKRADGTWVVVFASGYNNTTGDGNGHLYVLNANTGVPSLPKIGTFTVGTTPAGTSATPSGLAKINAWVDDPSDNTAKRFYGGDLLGNLWRFDVDNLVAPNQAAMLLASFKVTATTPQPITIRPEPVEVSYSGTKYPVVLIGTGRYLGTNDIEDTTLQSVYAVKDTLTATGWGDVRAGSSFDLRTITTSGSARTVAGAEVNWGTKAGWRMDFPANSRERVVTNMAVIGSKVGIASAIPGTSVCTPSGGSSWLYQFDFANGGAVAQGFADRLIMGLSSFLTGTGGDGSGSGGSGQSGATGSKFLGTGSDGSLEVIDAGSGGGSTGAVRRTTWRELVN